MAFLELDKRTKVIQHRLKESEYAQSVFDRAISLSQTPGFGKVEIKVSDENTVSFDLHSDAPKEPSAQKPNGNGSVIKASTDAGPVLIDANTVIRVLEDDRRDSDRERSDFTEGVRTLPIVDKDDIPEIVNGVYPALRNNKLGRSSAKQIASQYEQNLYDGNPDTTSVVLGNAKKLIEEA